LKIFGPLYENVRATRTETNGLFRVALIQSVENVLSL
jgi:hypothetical protein